MTGKKTVTTIIPSNDYSGEHNHKPTHVAKNTTGISMLPSIVTRSLLLIIPAETAATEVVAG